jgi:hypothetical protein
MSTKSTALYHANSREHFAEQLRVAGWIGFALELVLGVVSSLVLMIALLDPGFNINLKSGLGLVLSESGLIVLGISVYWMFSYTRIAQTLLSANPAEHLRAEQVRRTSLINKVELNL